MKRWEADAAIEKVLVRVCRIGNGFVIAYLEFISAYSAHKSGNSTTWQQQQQQHCKKNNGNSHKVLLQRWPVLLLSSLE